MRKCAFLQRGGRDAVLQRCSRDEVLQCGGKGAAGPAVALHCGGLRFATTALRCSGPGPSGITRCVRSAHCAQTDAASQFLMRASAPALGPPLLSATEARHRRPSRAFATPLVVREWFSLRCRVKHPRAAQPVLSRGEAGLSRGAPQLLAGRRAVPGSGAVCVGEKRRHAVGARSAHQELTRCDCLSAESAANAASFATRPRAEHRSGVGAQRRPTQPAPLPGTARRDAPPSPSPSSSPSRSHLYPHSHSLHPNTAATFALRCVRSTEER